MDRFQKDLHMFLTRHISHFLFLLFVMGFSDICVAGEPTEQIRETTDKILSIVSDPYMKKPEKIQERNRLLRKAVDERFDWNEMARRALGRHWNKRTEAEKREFIRMFGDLLEQVYMDKVGEYSGERVIYAGEKVDEDYGVVKVKIANHNQREIPVIYRLNNKKGDWLVYDILIEGVSFIHNYRIEFNNTIVRSSYAELIEKLRAKIAKE